MGFFKVAPAPAAPAAGADSNNSPANSGSTKAAPVFSNVPAGHLPIPGVPTSQSAVFNSSWYANLGKGPFSGARKITMF